VSPNIAKQEQIEENKKSISGDEEILLVLCVLHIWIIGENKKHFCLCVIWKQEAFRSA